MGINMKEIKLKCFRKNFNKTISLETAMDKILKITRVTWEREKTLNSPFVIRVYNDYMEMFPFSPELFSASKDIWTDVLNQLAQTKGVLALVFVSESWVRMLNEKDADEDGNPYDNLTPSESPNKQEAIIVSLSSPLKNEFYIAFIKETEKEKVLEKFKNNGNKLKGRFTNFMKVVERKDIN